jgi:hypothetical protein
MIPKSVQRFSDKIMLKQEARAGRRFNENHPALAHFPPRPSQQPVVIAGLDPAIHHLRNEPIAKWMDHRTRVYPSSGLSAQAGLIRLAWSSPRVTHLGAESKRLEIALENALAAICPSRIRRGYDRITIAAPTGGLSHANAPWRSDFTVQQFRLSGASTGEFVLCVLFGQRWYRTGPQVVGLARAPSCCLTKN